MCKTSSVNMKSLANSWVLPSQLSLEWFHGWSPVRVCSMCMHQTIERERDDPRRRRRRKSAFTYLRLRSISSIGADAGVIFNISLRPRARSRRTNTHRWKPIMRVGCHRERMRWSLYTSTVVLNNYTHTISSIQYEQLWSSHRSFHMRPSLFSSAVYADPDLELYIK